jgi:hypothetical protein
MGDKIGEGTLKVVGEGRVNRFGDRPEEDVETRPLTGVFELVSGQKQEVDEGEFEDGDLRIYVEPDNGEGVETGNIVEYQGKEYRIEEVLEMEIGFDGHLEVRAVAV